MTTKKKITFEDDRNINMLNKTASPRSIKWIEKRNHTI